MIKFQGIKTEMYAKNVNYICFEYIYLAYIFVKYIIVIDQMVIDLYGGLLSQKIFKYLLFYSCVERLKLYFPSCINPFHPNRFQYVL